MKTNKYSREIKPGVFVDVYDVLNAFKTGSAAVDHAVKKLLAPGQRGVKSREQDLNEAIASIRRAVEIEGEFEDHEEEVIYGCCECKYVTRKKRSEEKPILCPNCQCKHAFGERGEQ